jgi:hypothetical protein
MQLLDLGELDPEPLLTDSGMVWFDLSSLTVEEYHGDLASCLYDWRHGHAHYRWNVSPTDIDSTPFAALSMRNIKQRHERKLLHPGTRESHPGRACSA